ncbi:hypothetical protein VF12_35240 [Nostoc linckia z15]|nr:hypothetical protein VF12_35240 [Nostoc linckia z15]
MGKGEWGMGRKGKGERGMGKGEWGKVLNTSDLLHKSAFCTFVVKGIHLYWGKGKYQTCTSFPRLLLEVYPLPLTP